MPIEGNINGVDSYLRRIPLPRANGQISQDAISLANAALEAAYPDGFGTIITPLDRKTILLLRDADSLRYIRLYMDTESHSAKKAHDDILRRETGARDLSQLRIWTMRALPGKPILYYEGEIATIAKKLSRVPDREYRKGISEATTSAVLVHENLHRAGNYRDLVPVSPEDQLIDMAFTSARRMLRANQGSRWEGLLEEQYEGLRNYALEHDPMVRIHGTRVALYSSDSDGVMRLITSSGYDLEEGVVDSLGDRAYEYILNATKTRYGYVVHQIVSDTIKKMHADDGNYNFRNIKLQVPPYFRKLGLEDSQAALEVFAEGGIPKLHMDLIQNEYFP